MNLLVTGGAGFIGSNFIHYMISKYPDYKIVNYDKLTYAGNIDNLKDLENNLNYKFIKGDIIDYDLLNKTVIENKIDYIINFAAESHVDRSIYGFAKEFIITNVLGTQTILEVVKNNREQIKRLLHVSTDEVYGTLDLEGDDKFKETDPFEPNSPYSASKASSDLFCRAYLKTFNLPIIVTHCSNNYGPYQFPEKMIPFFILKLLKNEKVPVYGDGSNIRDWIHVIDHSTALSLLLHKGIDGETYNIGSDNEVTNMELTKLLLKIMNKDESNIEYVKDRPGHDKKYAINSTKIKDLGWIPVFNKDNFEKGLKETVEWYLNNKDWIDNIEKNKKLELNTCVNNK